MNDSFYDGAERECAAIDCDHKSKSLYTPTVQLWAKGYKRGDHEPAELKITAFFCSSCKLKIKDSEFLDLWFKKEIRSEIAEASKAIGKAQFNWASAKIKWVKV
jgi:hypothetical protein